MPQSEAAGDETLKADALNPTSPMLQAIQDDQKDNEEYSTETLKEKSLAELIKILGILVNQIFPSRPKTKNKSNF